MTMPYLETSEKCQKKLVSLCGTKSTTAILILFFFYFMNFQALEDFLWQSSDMLDRLDDMREDLGHNDFADDVGGAKKGMEQHNELRRKILKIPVENIDSVGQRILQR